MARSVKVETSILGVQVGDELEETHEKLDSLGTFVAPPKEAGESEEHEEKILWTLRETDYRALLVKAEEDRVTSITGYLRDDKTKPFESIGDVQVAPVHSESQVAWDIVRPGRPHLRVVASGDANKAASITVFAVKRSHVAHD